MSVNFKEKHWRALGENCIQKVAREALPFANDTDLTDSDIWICAVRSGSRNPVPIPTSANSAVGVNERFSLKLLFLQNLEQCASTGKWGKSPSSYNLELGAIQPVTSVWFCAYSHHDLRPICVVLGRSYLLMMYLYLNLNMFFIE